MTPQNLKQELQKKYRNGFKSSARRILAKIEG